MKNWELKVIGSSLLASVASVTLIGCGFVQAATPINSARPAATHRAVHKPKAKPRPRKVGPPTAIPTPGWTWQLGAKNRIANIAANWALAWLEEKNWSTVSADAAPGQAKKVQGEWVNGITVVPKDGGKNHVTWQPLAIQIGQYPETPGKYIVLLYARSVSAAGKPTLAQGLATSRVNYGGNQVGWDWTQGVKTPTEYTTFIADITIPHQFWKQPVTDWNPEFMLDPIGSTTASLTHAIQTGWSGMGVSAAFKSPEVDIIACPGLAR